MPPLSQDDRPPLHPGSPSSSDVDHSPASSPASTREANLKFPIFTIAERAVKFLPVLKVVQIQNVESYSPEEAEQIWYSEKELRAFENDAAEVAQRMARRTLRRTECGRGLEQRTPKGLHETRSARINGALVVFSEQCRQEQLMIRDEVKLAQMYSTISQISAIKAQDLAAVDALDAKIHQEEDSHSDYDSEEGLFECWFFSPAKWLGARARVAPLLLHTNPTNNA